MNLLFFVVTPIFFSSPHCQAADKNTFQLYHSHNQESLNSLSGLVFGEYPELVFNHDDSDFACAFVLGTYISQPKNDLLYIYPTKDHVAIYVDVAS